MGIITENAKVKLREIISENNFGGETVGISIGTLTAKQAIGNPKRQDYPIIEGKEVMIEARFKDSHGQAFTDSPHEFSGPLNEILNLKLDTNNDRAIFIATLNAVMAHLGKITGTRHCRDEEPEKCAVDIAKYVLNNHGKKKIGLIGLQPAILENLVKVFGEDNVHCTDLNPQNIGTRKYGAEIWDGRNDTTKLIKWCDILLATSSTIVNGTFDDIKAEADAQGKELIIFGVTGAGIAELFGLKRLCFQGH